MAGLGRQQARVRTVQVGAIDRHASMREGLQPGGSAASQARLRAGAGDPADPAIRAADASRTALIDAPRRAGPICGNGAMPVKPRLFGDGEG
jgi:hypothetical protein